MSTWVYKYDVSFGARMSARKRAMRYRYRCYTLFARACSHGFITGWSLVGAEMEMMRVIRRRQLRFLGHVMRHQQMQGNCIVRKLNGKKAKWRPRNKFLVSLAKTVGGGTRPVELLLMTNRREDWRSMVALGYGTTVTYGNAN